MTQTHDPLIGKQLGAYLIQAKLGEGGMASVYKGYHSRLRREVAIKVIAPHIADKADFQARFEREAQLIASLEHHNIVAVYDFGEEKHLTYLVMQYVGGGTLREQLRGHALEPKRAANYALQMARALHHAHRGGIVHRDVKPQNMLIATNDPNQLLLSDFGIAKLFDSSQEKTRIDAPTPGGQPQNPALTSVDQIVGTAEYMAPEQIQKQAVDARSDVYALGVVLYQMLTGRAPFQAGTAVGMMYQHVHTLPTPVQQINPRIPAALAIITARALEKAPQARFQSTEEMAQALEAALHSLNAAPTLTDNAIPRQAPDQAHTQPPQINSALPFFPGSQAGTPATHAHSFNTPNTSMNIYTTQSVEASNPSATPPMTHATGTPLQFPAHPRRSPRLRTLMTTGLTIFILALIVWRALPLLGIHTPLLSGNQFGPNSSGNTPTTFTETFQNNSNNWVVGSQNGLQASLTPNHYGLQVNDNQTHFPYPQSSTQTLPKDFTLQARLTQNSGPSDSAYGIVFNLKISGSQITSYYAFVITAVGNYGYLKYNAATASSDTISGSSSAIHTGLKTSNSLKVVVQNGNFHFFINEQAVQINDQAVTTDTTYTGGVPGLLVAGQNASFTASMVEVTVP